MCNYCFEALAASEIAGHDLLATDSADTQHDQILARSISSMYRPNMRIGPIRALRAFTHECNDQYRSAKALALMLRDDDRLFHDALSRVALETPEGYVDICYTSPSRTPCKQVRSALAEWYRHSGRMLLKRWRYHVLPDDHSNPSVGAIVCALWAGYRTSVSSSWLAICHDIAGSWAASGPPGDCDALWLRREARLALWRVGARDEVKRQDSLDPYPTTLYWIGQTDDDALAACKMLDKQDTFS